MKKYDRMSTLFFVGLAIAIGVESVRMGIGSLSNPGPGLIPLASGSFLGILSLIGFARTLRSSTSDNLQNKRINLGGRTISALVSMVAFSFLIDPLGFNVVTFFWMGFICRWIGRMEWKATVFTSLVATFSAWLIFEYLLEIRFPHGIWGI
jgi:putative tricarboxylic transport membrane protein